LAGCGRGHQHPQDVARSPGASTCKGPVGSGSDGYLAWVDHVLGIRETAHVDLSTLDYDYDFRVFDSPGEIRRLIEARNDETGRARTVAGYCWRWESKKDPEAWDVVLDEHDFRMRWNLTRHGSGWLAHPDFINEMPGGPS